MKLKTELYKDYSYAGFYKEFFLYFWKTSNVLYIIHKLRIIKVERLHYNIFYDVNVKTHNNCISVFNINTRLMNNKKRKAIKNTFYISIKRLIQL